MEKMPKGSTWAALVPVLGLILALIGSAWQWVSSVNTTLRRFGKVETRLDSLRDQQQVIIERQRRARKERERLRRDVSSILSHLRGEFDSQRGFETPILDHRERVTRPRELPDEETNN